MIKLYFRDKTKQNVIKFCSEMLTKYAWVVRKNYIEICGLSDITYIYNKFTEMHDYDIKFDIHDIRVQEE